MTFPSGRFGYFAPVIATLFVAGSIGLAQCGESSSPPSGGSPGATSGNTSSSSGSGSSGSSASSTSTGDATSSGTTSSAATGTPATTSSSSSSGSAGSTGDATTGAGGSTAGSGGSGAGGSATGAGGAGGRATGGAGGAIGTGGSGGGSPVLDGGAYNGTTAVIFFIDGLTPQAVDTGLTTNMIPNIKAILDGGVRVQVSHSPTPTARVTLPSGATPNGGATAGNRTPHTGTHLIEADHDGLDDIFKVGTAAGLKSLLVVDDGNYSIFTTPTVREVITTAAGATTDDQVITRAVALYNMNKPQIIRIHLQHIRTAWTGPAGLTMASSPYIQYLIDDDRRMGTFIQALKDGGVWDKTFFVLGSDHGMGTTSASAHSAAQLPSWNNFMAWYGPGLKKGATIPYGENPDIPVTLLRLMGLPPLKGHTVASVTIAVKGTTGQYLSNLLAGAPAELTPPHPKYIEQFLMTTPTLEDNYTQYRDGMIRLIK